MTIVFLDTETTGLNPDCDIWEIGLIVRDHKDNSYNGEWLWQLRPNLRNAEPMGLAIGRFYERFQIAEHDQAALVKSPGGNTTYFGWATEMVVELLCKIMDGAMWVGAVPSFDELRLNKLVDRYGWKLTHHYHLIDVEPLAAGYLAHQLRSQNFEMKAYDPENPDAPRTGPSIHVVEGLEAIYPPWKSKDLTRMIGAEVPEDEEHTALGDARWAMRVFDKVFPTSR